MHKRSNSRYRQGVFSYVFHKEKRLVAGRERLEQADKLCIFFSGALSAGHDEQKDDSSDSATGEGPMGSGASTRSRQGSAMSDEWVVLVGICVEGGSADGAIIIR
ncbi:hypothetical protein FALCPG4_005002 [Fusarium falciforme]